MKRLIIFFLLTVGSFSFSQESVQIGEIEDGEIVTELNSELILSRLNSMYPEGTVYTKLNVLEGIDSEAQTTYYYILIENEDKSVNSAFLLSNEDNILMLNNSNTNSVTCTGCSFGCNPLWVDKIGWTCTHGCGLDCTKSVTINTSRFMQAL